MSSDHPHLVARQLDFGPCLLKIEGITEPPSSSHCRKERRGQNAQRKNKASNFLYAYAANNNWDNASHAPVPDAPTGQFFPSLVVPRLVRGIANEDLLGKGLGTAIVNQFLEKLIFEFFAEKILIDPVLFCFSLGLILQRRLWRETRCMSLEIHPRAAQTTSAP
jgi:hypothetical protein